MTRKIAFFERWSRFRFNNFGLAPGTNLKFCTNVAKGSKLKVRKFWGPNPKFVEVTGEKLVGGAFLPPPASWIGLSTLTSFLLDLGWNSVIYNSHLPFKQPFNMTLKGLLNTLSSMKTNKKCSNYRKLVKNGQKLSSSLRKPSLYFLALLRCLIQMEEVFLFFFTSSVLTLYIFHILF